MNLEYLRKLHEELGIQEPFLKWVESVKDNDKYLENVHKAIGVKGDWKDWKRKVWTESEKVVNNIDHANSYSPNVSNINQQPNYQNIGTKEYWDNAFGYSNLKSQDNVDTTGKNEVDYPNPEDAPVDPSNGMKIKKMVDGKPVAWHVGTRSTSKDENGKDLSIRDIIKNNNLNLKDNKEANAKEKGWDGKTDIKDWAFKNGLKWNPEVNKWVSEEEEIDIKNTKEVKEKKDRFRNSYNTGRTQGVGAGGVYDFQGSSHDGFWAFMGEKYNLDNEKIESLKNNWRKENGHWVNQKTGQRLTGNEKEAVLASSFPEFAGSDAGFDAALLFGVLAQEKERKNAEHSGWDSSKQSYNDFLKQANHDNSVNNIDIVGKKTLGDLNVEDLKPYTNEKGDTLMRYGNFISNIENNVKDVRRIHGSKTGKHKKEYHDVTENLVANLNRTHNDVDGRRFKFIKHKKDQFYIQELDPKSGKVVRESDKIRVPTHKNKDHNLSSQGVYAAYESFITGKDITEESEFVQNRANEFANQVTTSPDKAHWNPAEETINEFYDRIEPEIVETKQKLGGGLFWEGGSTRIDRVTFHEEPDMEGNFWQLDGEVDENGNYVQPSADQIQGFYELKFLWENRELAKRILGMSLVDYLPESGEWVMNPNFDNSKEATDEDPDDDSNNKYIQREIQINHETISKVIDVEANNAFNKNRVMSNTERQKKKKLIEKLEQQYPEKSKEEILEMVDNNSLTLTDIMNYESEVQEEKMEIAEQEFTKKVTEAHAIHEAEYNNAAKPIINKHHDKIMNTVNNQFHEEESELMQEVEKKLEEEFNVKESLREITSNVEKKLIKEIEDGRWKGISQERIQKEFLRRIKEERNRFTTGLNKDYEKRFKELTKDLSNRKIKLYNELLNKIPELKEINEKYVAQWTKAYDGMQLDFLNNFNPKTELIPDSLYEEIYRNMTANDESGRFSLRTTDNKRLMVETYWAQLQNKFEQQGDSVSTIAAKKKEFFHKTYMKMMFDHEGALTLVGLKEFAEQTIKELENQYGKDLNKTILGEHAHTGELRMSKADRRALRAAKDILKGREHFSDYGAANFFKGVHDAKFSDWVPIAGDVFNLFDNIYIHNLATKDPKDLTKKEEQFLLMNVYNQQVQNLVREKSNAYNAGRGLSNSVKMIVEFGLMWNPAGWAGKGVKGTVGVIGKNFIRLSSKTLQNSVKAQKFLPGAKTALTLNKSIANTFGFLAEVTTMSSAGMPRVFSEAYQGMTPEMSWTMTKQGDEWVNAIDIQSGTEGSFGKELAKAYGRNWTEFASERFGAALPFMNKWLNKRIGGAWDDVGKRIFIGRAMKKLGINPAKQDVLRKLKQMGGWNGFIGEMLEEVVVQPAQNLIDGNGFFDGMDADFFKEIMISTFAMQMMFGSFNAGYKRYMGIKDPSYNVDGVAYASAKDAIAALKVLKQKGLITPEMEIKIDNDYSAWHEIDNILKGTDGVVTFTDQHLKTVDIAKTYEIEAMDHINQEQQQDVENINKQIEDITDKIDVLENNKNNDNKNEILSQILELQNQKNALETAKHNILKPALAKVNKLRSEKKYKQMVNLVKNVFAKKDPNTNVLEFNSSEHTKQFAELAYTQKLLNEHFGVTMNFKTKKDSKGNTIVDPKSITYVDTETGYQYSKDEISTMFAQNDKGQTFNIEDIDKEVDAALDDFTTTHGFAHTNPDGTETLIFNKEASLNLGAHNVAAHEWLHRFLNKTFAQNPHVALAVGRHLHGYLMSLNPSELGNTKFAKRLKYYQETQGDVVSAEETLNLFSDALATGEIVYNERNFTKIGDMIRRAFSAMGVRVNFNTGRDVFNFIRDYNRSMEKGKMSWGMQRTMAKGARITGVIKTGSDFYADQLNEMGYKQEADGSFAQFSMEGGVETVTSDALRNQIDPGYVDGKYKSKLEWDKSSDKKKIQTNIYLSDALKSMIRNTGKTLGLGGFKLDGYVDAAVAKVYDKFNSEYDPTRINKEFGKALSPFEWLTTGHLGKTSILYRAIGDIRNKYKTDVLAQTTSYDVEPGMADILGRKARKFLDEEEGIEIKKDLVTVGSALELSKGQIKEINEIINKTVQIEAVYEGQTYTATVTTVGGIDIRNLTYKDFKKLVLGNKAPMKGVLDVFAKQFGIPTSKIIENKDLTTSQRKLAQQYTKEKASQLKKQILPEGHTASGKATGVQPKLLKPFYVKGERVKMQKTGSKQGNPAQVKKDNISNIEYKAAFGINPDGTFINNKKFDGALRAQPVQAAMIAANQMVRKQALDNVMAPVDVIALVGDGKSAFAYSQDPKYSYLSHIGGIDNFVSPADLTVFHGRVREVSDNLAVDGYNVVATEAVIKEVYKDLPANSSILKNADKIAKAISNTVKGYAPKAGYGKGFETRSAKIFNALLKSNQDNNTKISKFLGTNKTTASIMADVKNLESVRAGELEYLYIKAAEIRNKYKGDNVKIGIELIKLLQQHQGHNATAGKVGGNRNQNYKNNKTFYDTMRAIDTNLNFKLKKDKTGWKIDPDSITYNNIKILKPSGYSGQNGLSFMKDYQDSLKGNKTKLEKRQNEIKEAQDALNNYAKFWVNKFNAGQATLQDLQIVMANLLSNMNPMLARAAMPEYIAKDLLPKNFKDMSPRALAEWIKKNHDRVVYEHMIPRVNLIIGIFDAHFFGKGDVDVKNIFKNYTVAVISDKMDKRLKKSNLNQALAPGQTLFDPSWIRYFNDATLGFEEMSSLINVNDNKVLDASAAYNAAGKVLNGQRKQIKDFKVYTNMLRFSRDVTQGPKGVSIWDFDHTLATTKSGVYANIPNKDGLPKPNRKVIFLAGGAGSGKSNVIRQLGLKKDGFKIINSDKSLEWLKKNNGLPANMNDLTPKQSSILGKLQYKARQIAAKEMMNLKGKGDGVVVDTTGGSLDVMNKQVQEFKDKGYDVQMVFVETSLQTSLERNKARKERSLLDSIVIKNHEKVQGNKEAFKKIFGDNFAEVKTDKLKQNDPMPPTLTNKVNDFTKGYEKRRLTADEFATEGKNILDLGGKFDFSEFNKVVEGEKGPMFGKAMNRAKKFGTKDQFILTARPMEAAPHIYEFLKSQGLNIPLKNIAALADSTAQAKALWIADNIVAQGYNDIYFADDVLSNVEAVKNILDQFDVKSKVQQAKLKFSKEGPLKFSEVLDEGKMDLNTILEETKGIEAGKEFSRAKAKQRGQNKGRFTFFIPPSAEDFEGLCYSFLGKGKIGEKHHAWFKKNLFDPYSKGVRALNLAKQSIADDVRNLKRNMPDVKKSLKKTVPGSEYTYEQAVRVYLWDKNNYDVPGLSKTDKAKLLDFIKKNPKFKAFADSLDIISSKATGYAQPGNDWMGGNINSDMNDTLQTAREHFLGQWLDNKNIIFSEKNLNKIEAIFGPNFREAMEDILWRMENGTNRRYGSNRLVNNFMDWINGSIGATMFVNMRSAVLQGLSTVNFINWHDNNPFKAAAAFANLPQFCKDFMMIFNSNWLRQRRSGLQHDVNANEMMNAIKNAKNPVRAAIGYLLQKGFKPTQIMDSFAISSGGATMYRNRVKTYMKQGMNKKDAESQAFLDLQEIAEPTQQSSRPDRVSQQQASALGKLILAFQNTPMQYMRLTKKAFRDLINGRGDWKTNMSKIIYYSTVQNLIFYSLQTALFAVAFGADEDEEKWEDDLNKRKIRTINGMLDSILRGTGVGGAIVSTAKNMVLKFMEQEKKKNPDHAYTLIEMLNLSPPIGIKARKLYSATQTWEFNREVIDYMSKTDIDNPMYSAMFNLIEATTNTPTARLYNKMKNVREALDDDNEAWQRIALFMGWNRWDLGIQDDEIMEVKNEISEIKKIEKKKKAEEKKQEKLEIKKQEFEEKEKSFLEQQKKEKKEKKKDIKCAAVSQSGKRCRIKIVGNSSYCTIHQKVDKRTDGKKVQCKKIKGGGERCKMKTNNKSGLCYYHD